MNARSLIGWVSILIAALTTATCAGEHRELNPESALALATQTFAAAAKDGRCNDAEGLLDAYHEQVQRSPFLDEEMKSVLRASSLGALGNCWYERKEAEGALGAYEGSVQEREFSNAHDVVRQRIAELATSGTCQ